VNVKNKSGKIIAVQTQTYTKSSQGDKTSKSVGSDKAKKNNNLTNIA